MSNTHVPSREPTQEEAALHQRMADLEAIAAHHQRAQAELRELNERLRRATNHAALDLTDRWLAQEALDASERQYRATLDAMVEAIHVVDSDLRILLANRTFQAWCAQYDLTPNLTGKKVFEAFPFLSDKVRTEYQEVFRHGKVLITEETTTVGSIQMLTETRKIPIVENGVVTRVVTVVRDITDRQLAEDTLKKNRDRLDQINSCLLALGSNHDANINRLTALCRQMLAYSGRGRFVTQAIFRIMFPAVSKSLDPTKMDLEIDAWQGRGTVLLVEDEALMRRVAKKMLERFGFQVIVAADGREALRQFQSHVREIVCVLLDLTMPSLDGEETLRELRRLEATVPVILASGYSEQEIARRFAGQPPAGFIEKPYQMASLRAKLHEVLNPLEPPPNRVRA